MNLNNTKPGRVCTFTAPAGGVTSGVAVAIGSLVVVPTNTIAAGLSFEGAAEGIFPLAKLTGTAWTEGGILYFDTADSKFKTATNATAFRAGTVAAAAAAADVTGMVRLNGVSAPVNVA